MGLKRTDEFRADAVRIALTTGLTRKQVASDLGVGLSTLNKWVTAHRDTDVVPEKDLDLARENERLSSENHILKEEREMEMNLQLHHVVSDITGATGMRIIRAIVGGERDPEVLAAFRDIRCKSSMDTIKAALVGNDREEHVFALTQSLELYDFYKAKIETCDRKLEAAVAALTVRAEGDLASLPKARIKGRQHNAPSFDVRAALYGVLGTDLTQIQGLGPSLALKLVAECGTDMRAWKSAKHFTSWLCLAPDNKISGGKLLSSRTR